MELTDLLEKYAKKPEGWLGVGVSPEIRARLRLLRSRINKDDLAEDGLENNPHVTLAFGLDEKLPEDKIQELLDLPRGSKIRLGNMSTFDNPEHTVLKMDVDGAPQELHKYIEDNIGIPGKTFPDYKPHVTIAYLKKGVDPSKYMNMAKILEGKEFDAEDIRLNLGDMKHASGKEAEKRMPKAASSGTEQLGSMVPFMDFPYAAGLLGPEVKDSEIAKRNKSEISDILLPPLGAYRYGQRMRAGLDDEETGPHQKSNYMSEILGPYSSTALIGLASVLASFASKGKARPSMKKAFLRGAGIGAGMNIAGWAGGKIDSMATKEEMQELDAQQRWSNWLVPGASKYHGGRRVEYMYEKPDNHDHLLDKNKRMKPGVYMANRSVFRGVPFLGSYLKDARHSYIVAVPSNPEQFKDRLVDIGNGNNVIIMGGYNEPLPDEFGKRQLTGTYNKDRDIETLQSGLGITTDRTRNYTKIKPITKGWSPRRIDRRIKDLTKQMDTYQAHTEKNPVVYSAFPSKNPKKVIKKRISNCNSFAQTLLDRAGFDNRRTKINNPNNKFAPGDTTRIDFAFEKPPVTAMPMQLRPNEKQEYVKEMKKAAFLAGYNQATGLMKQASDLHPYANMLNRGAINRRMGDPMYGAPIRDDNKAPVMEDSSSLVRPLTSAIVGDGVAADFADFGTYFIPGVGLVRAGYDTVADAANVFGKDLSLKQRLGYGLSSGFNALFAGADAMTLGMGGGALTRAALKPLTFILKSMKGGKKILRGAKRFQKATKAIDAGTHAWTKGAKGFPMRFMFSKNPYFKIVNGKKVFSSKPKALLRGVAKATIPMGGMLYAGGLTHPKPDNEAKMYEPDEEFAPENYSNESYD